MASTGVFSPLNFRTVAGAAAGDITVTGINVGDKIVAVCDVGAAAANLASEFTVTAANTINNTGGTSTAGHIVLVIWESYANGRDAARVPSGRMAY